jgi:D-3-phosphoglycerate dehydrogenase
MPSQFRVLLTDRAWPDTVLEQHLLAAVGAELIEPPATDEATLVAAVTEVDAIATNWARVTPAVVRAAGKCRIIARTGIGVDNIAILEATARGIPVTNVPDYCIAEVADHTIALLLACARRIAFFQGRTKRGEYNLQAAAPMRRLSTQTLGLIGLGRIGTAVAQRAMAFGLQIVAQTPSGNPGVDCRMVSLDELLATSDFVSLHAPLTDATRTLINATTLARMKPTATLINTSRGGLIDERAVWNALQQNRLGAVALDVFDPEPPDLSQPLFRDERVIVTPHAAFVSEESLVDLRQRAMGEIVAVLSGQRPQNVLNPQIYAPTA